MSPDTMLALAGGGVLLSAATLYVLLAHRLDGISDQQARDRAAQGIRRHRRRT